MNNKIIWYDSNHNIKFFMAISLPMTCYFYTLFFSCFWANFSGPACAFPFGDPLYGKCYIEPSNYLG